ncbi:MAG: SAM-dependent methyltransferase [Mucilaginibacter polytrichastri]|nr:SAM-dependent methyltransferase [Mucilaginibacter polytrichastri]
MQNGTLFLIPVPLADDVVTRSAPLFLQETVARIDEYIVENEKTARKFLRALHPQINQQKLVLHDYGKHTRRQKADFTPFFDGLLQGRDAGLMSEAGCPGVADPGADIVAEAHRRGIKVVPLVGPSSILLALMASGFSGQSFTFHGYLPIDKADRSRRIKELEAAAERSRQTQIFIETPFRNNPLLHDLLANLKPQTRLCVACDLTTPTETVISMPVSVWKKQNHDFHKRPAIFLLYKA